MTPENTILSELKGFSPYLAGIPRQLPYQAPVGYFENLPGLLLQKAKTPEEPKQELESLSPLLAGLSKKSPFSAPEAYFNSVVDEATAGINAIEQTREALENLHPILEAARKINPYQVPLQYFDEFPAFVLEKRPKTAKLIAIKNKWLAYSVAAAIVGVLVLAGWFYRPLSLFPVSNDKLARQLEKDMNQLSDEAIFNFADSAQLLFYGNTASGSEVIDDFDLHIMLEEVSDDALKQYLKEQPGKGNLFIN